MKVSVVISAYNEEQVIADCLTSLAAQNYPAFEIFMVDDGSTDSTAAVASSFDDVSVLRQDHKGPAVGRNFGAAYATGEILLFLDADMTFKPDFISRMVQPILTGRAVGTFCREVYISNPENIWARCWAYNRRTPLQGNIFPDSIPDEWNIFRAVLKDEFDSVGGFEDIGYGEDVSLGEKLAKPALAAEGAVFFHHNPSSAREVWQNAVWIGRGERVKEYGRRLWLRFSLPYTLYRGFKTAVTKRTPLFILFAMLYDSGVIYGVLARKISRRHSK